jgi:Ca-activated chloride channel family protein
MIFASPQWLWALLVLPLIAWAEVIAARRDRERTARLVARPLWPRVVRRTRTRWRWVRLALVLTAAAGILVALARPQWGIVREKVEREGVDVVFVLDTSGSMATEDVPPNRLFFARAALLSLVERLEGDRFGLVAFEGEAYPLVPLTLDADAIGLFLESVEPGIVPAPGTSLGTGLAKGIDLFTDKERRNKVMVLISDGEDLEGEIEEAVKHAKEAGVVVDTVGVGTEQGQPVPDVDRDGNRVGFKKDESGSVVVSHLNVQNLETIARETGGRFFRITPTEASLAPLAAAIEGMEQKSLAREFSYRHKERFQVPLGIALACLALALLLPPPALRRRRVAQAAIALLALFAPRAARAEDGGRVVDEVLLRPRRLTSQARKQYEAGNHPDALKAFEGAKGLRPADPAAQFNLADALYKSGRFDEAEAAYRALGGDARSTLAAPSRFNLGNALYQKKDYAGAVHAYRDALRLAPQDADTRKNLELALRALQEQQRQNQQKQSKDKNKDDQKKNDQQKQQQQQQQQQPKGGQKKQERPKSAEEQERERFQQETGMPKERAMQLLDALQQNEKGEQKKLLAAKRAQRKKGKDW